MSYIADTEIDLTEETASYYIISSQHRRTGNPNKSLWIVTFAEEVECFTQTIKEEWKEGTEAWGIIIDNNSLKVVGHNNSNQNLKIAKFVDGASSNVWHGYPADCMNKAQDRPTTSILKKWVANGYITKSKMSKIRLGQSCSL